MNHVRRRPIVAVIGSGAPDHGNPGLSEAIGRLIAEMGFHLLTGGGRGVMADASRGFTSVPDRAGLALGIIPRSATGAGVSGLTEYRTTKSGELASDVGSEAMQAG